MTERADWQKAVEFVGKHNSDLVTIAVDADGNLYAVLQGEYAGTLKTVKLDDEGRISAFVVDSVDAWGNLLEVGNAELAARIVRLPVSYDRRGQVLYWSDFSDGLGAWFFNSSGEGGGSLRETRALQGGYCPELTLTSAGQGDASLGLILPPVPTIARLGFSGFFALSAPPDYWRMRVRLFQDLVYTTTYVRATSADGKLWICNDAGGETEVGTWNTRRPGLDVWHYCKLAIDVENAHYIRLLIDGTEIDLSSHACYQATTDLSYLEIMFRVYDAAGVDATVLFDCPAVTVRE